MLQRFHSISPFWLLLAAVFVFLVCSPLLQEGCFMDGALYSTMARNMAEGIGTYSAPFVTETWLPQFHHSLQLGMVLESFLFSIFGDHSWVEKLYGIIMALLNMVLIVKIWQLLFRKDAETKRLAWFPALLWVTVPIVFWVFTNNMLEMTSSFFAVLAVWLTLLGLEEGERKILLFLLAGVCTFLAVMSKSIVGAFPLAVIGLHWLIVRKHTFPQALLYTFIVLGGFAMVFGLLLLYEPMRDALQEHWESMLVPSFEGKMGVDRGRFLVIKRVFFELIPMLGLSTLFLLIMKREIRARIDFKRVLFFIVLGIAASAPIMISQKQAGYYASPSYPYFATGVALLCVPLLKTWLSRVNTNAIGWKAFRIVAALALIGAITFTFVRTDRFTRHAEELTAVEEFAPILHEKGEIVSTCYSIRLMFHMNSYLYRKLYVSLEIEEGQTYYLGNVNCVPSDAYKPIKTSGQFVLYELRK